MLFSPAKPWIAPNVAPPSAERAVFRPRRLFAGSWSTKATMTFRFASTAIAGRSAFRVALLTRTGGWNVAPRSVERVTQISPVEPFNAPAPALDLDKVLIILTDGENTQNRWSSTASVIDARTQKVCDNIKAANIKLYTVRVIDGDVTLLKGCATKPSMFYDVQQAIQLSSVFSSIAQNLANLRITE